MPDGKFVPCKPAHEYDVCAYCQSVLRAHAHVIEGESEELGRRAAAGEAARYDDTASHIGGYFERFADSATAGLLPVA